MCLSFTLGPGNSETYWAAHVIVMVADVLETNRRQDISNHHTGSKLTTRYQRGTLIILHFKFLMLQSLNKQFLREVGRSATHWFLWEWWLHPLMMITPYVHFHLNEMSKISECFSFLKTWGLDKIADTLHMTFSNAISLQKIFHFKFHRSLSWTVSLP